jgi:hydroxymethylbilane synthase
MSSSARSLNLTRINGAAPALPEKLLGTRGSALALWQTEYVLDLLRRRWPDERFGLRTITTQGDRTQALQTPLTQLGDKSMFVAELERALLAGELDAAIHPMNDRALVEAEASVTPIAAAVHSLKDMPGALDPRLVIAAVPQREDARDALISRSGRTLEELPSGATVATGSLRRQAQIKHLRPDLTVVSIRGNVDTRLRKALASDGPDATVLALAGVRRLGLEAHVTQIMPVTTMVPAVGQGALAVEVRADDIAMRHHLRAIDHAPTRRAVEAERAVLATLGGGCQVPLGAHATVTADGATLRLIAVIASLDGTNLIRIEREGPIRRPVTLGRAVARDLLRQGAAEILRAILADHTS